MARANGGTGVRRSTFTQEWQCEANAAVADRHAYERNLEEARRRAEQAVSNSERQAWLTIAASWERLLGLEPQQQWQEQPTDQKKA